MAAVYGGPSRSPYPWTRRNNKEAEVRDGDKDCCRVAWGGVGEGGDAVGGGEIRVGGAAVAAAGCATSAGRRRWAGCRWRWAATRAASAGGAFGRGQFGEVPRRRRRVAAPGRVDIVVTSPPYLNNYHYNRNTRPHLYWLGFCTSPDDLKTLEELNFGSYWQNARVHDRVDLDADIHSTDLRAAIDEVRSQNPEKGVYGGNGWANYAARYFNDCARFVTGVRWCLRPGGTALVVIGNSILQGVPIATDKFLGEIAAGSGLELVDIHAPRDTRVGSSIVGSSVRAGTSKGHRLYESIVELRQAQ